MVIMSWWKTHSCFAQSDSVGRGELPGRSVKVHHRRRHSLYHKQGVKPILRMSGPTRQVIGSCGALTVKLSAVVWETFCC